MLNEMVLCEELFHSPRDVAFADFITVTENVANS